MDKIIVFAHMMKTAGTSLSKQLIGHFGRRMHIVPGGLKMDDDYYELKDIQNDIKKFNYKLQLIVGHPIRPYKNYNGLGDTLSWATVFREPTKRYVSHYLHDYKLSNEFSYPRYQNMSNSSIVEWEKIENCSNYQTKFIAGEESFERAVEILENKMEWIGLTEEFENTLCSFKHFFALENFHYDVSVTNKSLADKKKKEKVTDEFTDFINEKNSIDVKLYDYVRKHIWPKFKIEDTEKCINKGKNKPHRMLNMLLFQLNRQWKYKTEDFNLKNFKRFYNRWYR